MCLLDSHQIKYMDNIRFLVNFENNGVNPPNVHTIDLNFRMQAFYIRCVVRIFKFTEMTKNMPPYLLRKFLEGLNNTLLNSDFHCFASPRLRHVQLICED